MRLLNQILGIGGERKARAQAQAAKTIRVNSGAGRWAAQKNALQKKTVLVAEASDGFAFMLQRAFKEAGLPHMIRRVRDGAEALRYLAGQDEFADRQRFPWPDLLVAGSALPKVSGVEVLGYLRGEMGLTIPVVVFSATIAPLEMRRVMELGSAEYFVRPDVFSVLLEEVNGIEQKWLEARG